MHWPMVGGNVASMKLVAGHTSYKISISCLFYLCNCMCLLINMNMLNAVNECILLLLYINDLCVYACFYFNAFHIMFMGLVFPD